MAQGLPLAQVDAAGTAARGLGETMQEVKPKGGKTLCQDCPHWDPLFNDRDGDEYGVCGHTSHPWYAPERTGKEGEWSCMTQREQSCLLPAKGEP